MILVFAAFCIAVVKADIILGNNPAVICRSAGGTDTYCTWKYIMNFDPKKDPGYICGFEPPSGSRTPHHVALFDDDDNPLYVWSHKGTDLSYGKNTGLPLNDARMKSVSMIAHFPYNIESVLSGDILMRIRQCAGEPEYIPFINSLHNERITIPPGKAKVVVKASQHLTHGGEAKWFLVHAHNIGVQNRAKFERGSVERGSVERSTQAPQSFVPIETPFVVQKGDIAHFECEYDSTKMDTTTVYGPTHMDEMCVVYLIVVDKNPKWTKIPIKK